MKQSTLDFDREVRRARIFGTSALEIMLVITFILVLLLLAFSWTVAATEPGLRTDEPPTGQGGGGGGGGGAPPGAPSSGPDGGEHPPGGSKEDDEADAGNDDASPNDPTPTSAECETADSCAPPSPPVPTPEPDDPEPDDPEPEPGHRWPPIIRLEEADGYSFPTARNWISPEFARKLHGEVLPQIERYAAEYGAEVIEVVGHTDERPIAGRSNLDEALIPYLGGEARPLRPADNVGLAFTRAAAVARELAPLCEEHGYLVVALSAGQTLIPGDLGRATGEDRGDNPFRRTIEIRLRRRDPVFDAHPLAGCR